ncbi:MAG: TetR/AcrR family transcriptional regulator [Bradymonadaceae bacterium]|nr:TetR/AcrR family transcriptional regulator [Lujinxingiaceae bacterium]
MTRHLSPDERIDQILTAARTCFLAKGYFATKMDEIARESGLSKGGIYFHFASKREIFRSLVQQEYDAAMAFIDGVQALGGDVIGMLVQLGEHFVEQFAADREQPRFMVIIGEMALRDEAIQEMLLELQQSYIDRIATILELGMAQGQLRVVDARSIAVMLKALIDGIQATFAVGFEPDLETLLPATMDILMRGLVVDPKA